jgi:type I restriction enzyme M protein
MIARYFPAQRDEIAALDDELISLQQRMDEMVEENSGEDGLLAEVVEGEGDKRKITGKAVSTRLKELGRDPAFEEEREVLRAYGSLLERQSSLKVCRKAKQTVLDENIDTKYPQLTEAEIKMLVINDKWMAYIQTAVSTEMERVSQTLTGRIRELAERYATPLPQLTDEVATLTARVEEHLRRMGAAWN